MAAAIQSAKKELRKLMRQRLSQVSNESIQDQSLHVFNGLTASPEYLKASRISVYLSMPTGEISTRSIVNDALSRGKTVFVPYLYESSRTDENWPSSIMDMIKLNSMKDFESLAPDRWGIPTLSADTIYERENVMGGYGVGDDQDRVWKGGLDMILMPAMAFDVHLKRLGHGKGYYDFFLHRYVNAARAPALNKGAKQGPKPTLVGLSLNEQLLPADEAIPTDSTDWNLDIILLGNGTALRAKTS